MQSQTPSTSALFWANDTVDSRDAVNIAFWAVLLETTGIEVAMAVHMVGPSVPTVTRYLDLWRSEAALH